MNANDLHTLVMEGKYCVHCNSPDEVRAVLRLLNNFGDVNDDTIRRIMEGDEPEDRWENYWIVGKSMYSKKIGVTLYSRATDRPAINYDQIIHLVDRDIAPEWVAVADFAALLV